MCCRAHTLPVDVKRRYVAPGVYTGPDVGKAELDYEVGTVATVRAWDYSRTRFTLAEDGGEHDPGPAAIATAAAEPGRFPPAEVLDPAYVEVLDDLCKPTEQLCCARGALLCRGPALRPCAPPLPRPARPPLVSTPPKANR